MALQYCIGVCHTSAWISHRYICVSSLLNLPPTSHPIPPLQIVTASINSNDVSVSPFGFLPVPPFHLRVPTLFFFLPEQRCKAASPWSLHCLRGKLSLATQPDRYWRQDSTDNIEQMKELIYRFVRVCLVLSNSLWSHLPGSSVHRIFQARILE